VLSPALRLLIQVAGDDGHVKRSCSFRNWFPRRLVVTGMNRLRALTPRQTDRILWFETNLFEIGGVAIERRWLPINSGILETLQPLAPELGWGQCWKPIHTMTDTRPRENVSFVSRALTYWSFPGGEFVPWLCQYVIEAPPPDTCTLATAGSAESGANGRG
jgi:hypothetical protein